MPTLGLAPGLHENISEKDYHADNLCDTITLSRSLAQVLIEQAPIHAFQAHPRLGGKPEAEAAEDDDTTPAMDFGSLGHKLLLGRGQEVVVGEWKTFATNAAKDFRKQARAEGKLPVLRKTYDRGVALKAGATEELKRLGLHDQFFAAKPEVVALFDDGPVRCRCMFDRLLIDGGSATVFDVKITDSANPKVCERQIQNMKYDLQDAFYLTGLHRLIKDIEGRARFIFLFIENSFPFVVTPIELDGAFKSNGISKYCHAYAIWQKCLQLNQWPAYVDGVYKASPKEWALAEEIGRQMPKFKE